MRSLSLILIITLPSSALATEQSLLYSVHSPVATRSGSCGTILAQIGREDVAVVTPIPGIPYSAETFLTHMNFNVMIGDKNGDANYWQAPLTFGIDAMTLCHDNPSVAKIRNLFVSPAQDIITACGAWLRRSDVGSYRPGGGFAFLIREEHIRDVFDIDPIWNVNVDAIHMLEDGSLFLSFENNLQILGGIPVPDGAIVFVPASALTYVNCEVVDTFPNSGFLALTEAQVDLMVQAANVSDGAGIQITTIGDVNGLERDPLGGEFQVEGFGMVPNLLFTGDTLQGGSILSTNGTIAQINGKPIGQNPAAATDGRDVGLAPGIGNPLLNGLALVDNPEPCRFILDTATPTPLAGAVLDITWGGADVGAPVALFFGIGVSGACNADPAVGFANPCFPYNFLLPNLVAVIPSPCDASSITFAYGGGVPAGTHFVFQGITLKGGALALSAPMLWQF